MEDILTPRVLVKWWHIVPYVWRSYKGTTIYKYFSSRWTYPCEDRIYSCLYIYKYISSPHLCLFLWMSAIASVSTLTLSLHLFFFYLFFYSLTATFLSLMRELSLSQFFSLTEDPMGGSKHTQTHTQWSAGSGKANQTLVSLVRSFVSLTPSLTSLCCWSFLGFCVLFFSGVCLCGVDIYIYIYISRESFGFHFFPSFCSLG